MANAKPAAETRDLEADLEAAKQQLAAAQAAAEAIATGENTALESDESYAAFLRRKTLSAREIQRLTKTVGNLKIAIDDELAQRELAEFERKYAAVAARNAELRARIVVFRDQIAPMIIKLIGDLARDEIDVKEINRFVPWGRGIYPADAAVRDRPSQQIETISEEIVSLWCDRTGQPVPVQGAVAVDANGVGTMNADFGTRRTECNLRKFKRVRKFVFTPASTALPLWKSLVIPRLDRVDAPMYDGRRVHSADHALLVLSLERREHPRDETVEMIPLDDAGNEIVSPRATEWGPPVE